MRLTLKNILFWIPLIILLIILFTALIVSSDNFLSIGHISFVINVIILLYAIIWFYFIKKTGHILLYIMALLSWLFTILTIIEIIFYSGSVVGPLYLLSLFGPLAYLVLPIIPLNFCYLVLRNQDKEKKSDITISIVCLICMLLTLFFYYKSILVPIGQLFSNPL
jgi:hypothetical protein